MLPVEITARLRNFASTVLTGSANEDCTTGEDSTKESPGSALEVALGAFGNSFALAVKQSTNMSKAQLRSDFIKLPRRLTNWKAFALVFGLL